MFSIEIILLAHLISSGAAQVYLDEGESHGDPQLCAIFESVYDRLADVQEAMVMCPDGFYDSRDLVITRVLVRSSRSRRQSASNVSARIVEGGIDYSYVLVQMTGEKSRPLDYVLYAWAKRLGD